MNMHLNMHVRYMLVDADCVMEHTEATEQVLLRTKVQIQTTRQK